MRSSSLNRCFFVGEVLDDRLEHEVAVGELAEVATRRVTRPSTASRSASSSLPRSTCLASDFSSPATIASAVACDRLRSTTSMPAFAATSAIPEPMIPEPTIPEPLDAHSLDFPLQPTWKRGRLPTGRSARQAERDASPVVCAAR